MIENLKEVLKQNKVGDEITFKNNETNKILNLKIKKIENGKVEFENLDINLSQNNKFEIFVDTRENITFTKELFKSQILEINLRKLEVCDIVIDEFVGIERKEQNDFLNSIIDKRLFKQVLELIRNYKRPILIIEGDGDLFNLRNINENVIYSVLSSLSIDFRLPIIFTKNKFETIKFIESLAKRRFKEKKEISVKKSLNSNNEDMENFISMIPKINKSSAKILLKNFKTIKKLINSTEKDFEKISGIGKVRAKYLEDFFNQKYDN